MSLKNVSLVIPDPFVVGSVSSRPSAWVKLSHVYHRAGDGHAAKALYTAGMLGVRPDLRTYQAPGTAFARHLKKGVARQQRHPRPLSRAGQSKRNFHDDTGRAAHAVRDIRAGHRHPGCRAVLTRIRP